MIVMMNNTKNKNKTIDTIDKEWIWEIRANHQDLFAKVEFDSDDNDDSDDSDDSDVQQQPQ